MEKEKTMAYFLEEASKLEPRNPWDIDNICVRKCAEKALRGRKLSSSESFILMCAYLESVGVDPKITDELTDLV